MPLDEARKCAESAVLVVDLVAHEVRIGAKRVAFTRHRALEPLLVQMLRHAHDGLTSEQILMAAGGPGPGSADAAHRVRVLVSRLRALLGAEVAVVTTRGAGELSGAQYQLASHVEFALIEDSNGSADGPPISVPPGSSAGADDDGDDIGGPIENETQLA